MTRTFMRLFKTNSVDIVTECQLRFKFCKVSETVVDRKRRFLLRYTISDNFVCKFFKDTAVTELLLLST